LCSSFQCKCEGYMTCTWRRWENATSCRAQRLEMKISFVERPSYELIGKKCTNYTIRSPRHLYRRFVASVSVFFKSCSLPYITNDGGSLLHFVSRRMEIQTCRKKGYYHIGFVDPQVVNCKNLQSNPVETFKNLYKYLTIQHYKSLILFPYNFA